MKLDIKKLLKVLKKVLPGVAQTELIEQTQCFAFTEKHIAAYNDEIAISAPFDIDFTGAIESKELIDLLEGVEQTTVKAKVKNGEFRISSKDTNAGLKFQKKITLPLDFLDNKIKFKPLPSDFNEAIKTCLLSVSNDLSTSFGFVHVADNFVESCNNYSFTRFTMDGVIKKDLLIPVNAVRHLNKYELTGYSKSNGWIHFQEESTGIIFSCHTIDNEYPDLDQFLKVKGKKITIPAKLYDVLNKSKIFVSDKNQPEVSIKLADNKCTVRSENEKGWIEKNTDMDVTDEIEFAVDANMLQLVLKNINKAVVGKTAIKFTAEKYVYIINLV